MKTAGEPGRVSVGKNLTRRCGGAEDVRKEMISITLAAEASKNLENVEYQSDPLDRGCVSRIRTA